MSSAPTRTPGAIGVMSEQCLARSPRGVVAAAAPTAAHVGASMLERGGNAFDAVVAAALCETVLLPPKCGLAGDLIALAWTRDEDRPSALLAIGGAPARLAEVALAGELSDTGPMSVGVPGAPAGYAALADRGVLGRAALAEPAISLAEDGFCWSTICTVLTEESIDLLRRHQPDGTRYLPGGAPAAPGAVVTLPGMARALRRFATDGGDLLAGEVGRAIVARVRAAGGVLTSDDLATARADWIAAASAVVGGVSVWVTPAPTHGPSLLDALDALGALDEAPLPAQVHAAVTAAARRRADTLADPSGTSMVSAVDRRGTLAVVVHSNSYPQYGSGLIVEDLDLVLSNRAGRGFTAEPGHPNFPAPGRRPATTLHAWAVGLRRGWRLAGATPGGANQMPWNAQTLAWLLADGESIDLSALARSIVAPRWQLDRDGGTTAEDGFDPVDLDALVELTGGVRTTPRWALRSAMQIVADAGEVVAAAVDPRTVGAVIPI